MMDLSRQPLPAAFLCARVPAFRHPSALAITRRQVLARLPVLAGRRELKSGSE
jgi:hypothetical protein